MAFARHTDFVFKPVEHRKAVALITRYHYARGAGNTSVLAMGAFEQGSGRLVGVALWSIPGSPNVARWTAKQFERATPDTVLSLSRLVVVPGQPKGLFSMLVKASKKELRRRGNWRGAVTYADPREGHTGHSYLVSGWTSRGHGEAKAKWVDANGRQVAPKAKHNRTEAKMKQLGYRKLPRMAKVRYIMAIRDRIVE